MAAPHSRKSQRNAARICALISTVMGMSVLFGYASGDATFVFLKITHSTTVLATAICLVTAGLAILADAIESTTVRRRIRMVAGAIVGSLAVGMLIEVITGVSLGIDFPTLHRPLQESSEFPGRMSLHSAFCLTAVAMGLVLLDRSAHRGYSMMLGSVAITVLSICSLATLGHLLNLEFLYVWLQSTPISAVASVAIGLLGVALTVLWRAERSLHRAPVSDAKRIHFVAVYVLIIVVGVTGISGFGAMQSEVEREAVHSLSTAGRDKRLFFDSQIEENVQHAQLIASQPAVVRAIVTLNRDAEDPAARSIVEATARRLLDYGFDAVRYSDQSGIVAHSGTLLEHPKMSVPVAGPVLVSLMWNGGFVLRSKVPIVDAGAVIGSFESDQSVSSLDRSAAEANSLGSTGELAMCAARGSELVCFPNRSHRDPLTIAATLRPGEVSPMARAVEGEVGANFYDDYRGRSVVSAYGPVGNTGIGLMLKMQTSELYEPVRRGFDRTMPLLLLFAFGGSLVVRRQLRPLTGALDRALSKSRQNEARFLGAAESSPDSIFILTAERDAHGTVADFRIAYCNTGGARFMKAAPPTFLSKTLSEVFAHGRAQRLIRKYAEVVTTGEPLVKVMRGGVGEQDEWIQHHASRAEDGVLLTIRDITDRKRADQELRKLASIDPLTLLPNRRSFSISLSRACEQAVQNGSGVAVLFFDLDGLKHMNDEHGHAAGDVLIQEFARRLHDAVRTSDTVARYAGDEFVVLLKSVESMAIATIVCEKIRVALRGDRERGGALLPIHASVGLSFRQGPACVPEQMLAEADARMYASKRSKKADPSADG